MRLFIIALLFAISYAQTEYPEVIYQEIYTSDQSLNHLRRLCPLGYRLPSILSASHVLWLRDELIRQGDADETFFQVRLGIPLAYDNNLNNEFSDLNNRSRSVTYIFDELKSKWGFSGQYLNSHPIEGQHFAGFGWGKNSDDVGISDWALGQTRGIICERDYNYECDAVTDGDICRYHGCVWYSGWCHSHCQELHSSLITGSIISEHKSDLHLCERDCRFSVSCVGFSFHHDECFHYSTIRDIKPSTSTSSGLCLSLQTTSQPIDIIVDVSNENDNSVSFMTAMISIATMGLIIMILFCLVIYLSRRKTHSQQVYAIPQLQIEGEPSEHRDLPREGNFDFGGSDLSPSRSHPIPPPLIIDEQYNRGNPTPSGEIRTPGRIDFSDGITPGGASLPSLEISLVEASETSGLFRAEGYQCHSSSPPRIPPVTYDHTPSRSTHTRHIIRETSTSTSPRFKQTSRKPCINIISKPGFLE